MPGSAASAWTASVSVASASPTFAPRPMYARTVRSDTSPVSGRARPAGAAAPARLDRCRRSPFGSSTRSRIRAAGPLTRWVADARATLAERHRRGFLAAGADDVAIVGGPPDDRPFGERLRELVADVGRRAGWSSSAPGRSRWRRRTTGGHSSRWRPGRRAGRSPTTATRRTSWRSRGPRRCPRSRTCRATTRCRAGSRRSPATGSTTCAGAGGSRSTSTGRSTSSSSAPAGRSDARRPLAARIADRRAPRRRRRPARRAAGRGPDVGGERWPGSSGTPRPGRGRWSRSAACGRHRAWRRPGDRRTAPDRPPGSILGLLLDRDGPGSLGDHLARFADAAIVDSRVLLAHRVGADEAGWPAAEDRFASDLLLAERIADPWLRELTASAAAAPDPDPARRPHARRTRACGWSSAGRPGGAPWR